MSVILAAKLRNYKIIIFPMSPMSKKQHNSEFEYKQSVIDLRKIDPFPYQLRRHFDEEKLKELAGSIQREGLIEPIVVRPKNDRYELIAGERRFRAVRDYTQMKTIQAQIVKASDLQARRISAAENLQREDLSAIETIEAVVEIVDAELIGDKEYASMGKNAADRVKTLLGKLDSVRRSKELGYEVATQARLTSHKFVGSVEKIFKKLPKPLEWRSFFNHDLPLLMDFCEEVQEVSIHHRLNRSQTRALAKLRTASEKEFQRVTAYAQSAPPTEIGDGGRDFWQRDLRDLSAREIEEIAEKAAKKESLKELNRALINPSFSREAKNLFMHRLGISVIRIASQLNVNRKTALKYSENPQLVHGIKESLRKGHPPHQVAQEHRCPEPLVWSIFLEGKNDYERFKALNWGLRAWDYWYFNDLDPRFGDRWPGQIPAQLVGHVLFYYTDEGDLVFDPMAGGGVVPDTCCAFNRRCWSFDVADRPETRPEIEHHRWNPESLVWPVKGKEKPDLIFFDPPYFKKQGNHYPEESISMLSRKEYLEFFRELFPLFREHAKADAYIAFLNADWREFQGKSPREEDPSKSIFLSHYIRLLEDSGWELSQILDCPLPTQRFLPNMVARMHKNRTLGVVRRSLIVGRKK